MRENLVLGLLIWFLARVRIEWILINAGGIGFSGSGGGFGFSSTGDGGEFGSEISCCGGDDEVDVD